MLILSVTIQPINSPPIAVAVNITLFASLGSPINLGWKACGCVHLWRSPLEWMWNAFRLSCCPKRKRLRLYAVCLQVRKGWSGILTNRQIVVEAQTSRFVWALSFDLFLIQEEIKVVPIVLHIQRRQLKRFELLEKMTPRSFSSEVSWICVMISLLVETHFWSWLSKYDFKSSCI